jgi:hypothetical protein
MKETVEDITGGVRDISISLKIWNCEHPSVHPYTSLINLEQPSIPRSTKSKSTDPVETEKGVPLVPSAKDLRPWYATNDSELDRESEKDKEGWDGRTYVSLHYIFSSIVSTYALYSVPIQETRPGPYV